MFQVFPFAGSQTLPGALIRCCARERLGWPLPLRMMLGARFACSLLRAAQFAAPFVQRNRQAFRTLYEFAVKKLLRLGLAAGQSIDDDP